MGEGKHMQNSLIAPEAAFEDVNKRGQVIFNAFIWSRIHTGYSQFSLIVLPDLSRAAKPLRSNSYSPVFSPFVRRLNGVYLCYVISARRAAF